MVAYIYSHNFFCLKIIRQKYHVVTVNYGANLSAVFCRLDVRTQRMIVSFKSYVSFAPICVTFC